MCASAREELLRPGLRGGGGGKPLLASADLGCATSAGGTLAAATFLLITTGMGLIFTGLRTTFATSLATAFAGGLTIALAGNLGVGLTAVSGLVLATALTGALALAGGAFASVLAADFFTIGLALTAGLEGFLTTDLAADFGADLAADLAAGLGTGLGLALAAALTTGLLTAGLATFLAIAFGLLAL